jgi:hypothetical protein
MPILGNPDAISHLLMAFRPRLFIIDFPDIGLGQTIRRYCEQTGACTMYLAMYARAAPQQWHRRFGGHTYVIGLEPEITYPTWPQQTITPLVNGSRLLPLTDAQQEQWHHLTHGQATDLLLETGKPRERRFMREQARKRSIATGVTVLNSLDLLQPAVRFADLASHVYSGAGYSAVWELCGRGALSRTRFHYFDRELEDCRKRVAVATHYDDPSSLRHNHGIVELAMMLRRVLEAMQ